MERIVLASVPVLCVLANCSAHEEPVPPAGPSVTLDFFFAAPPSSSAGGLSCSEAEVSKLTVIINPGSSSTISMVLPCSKSETLAGITSGTHDIEASAFDPSGVRIWDATVSQQDISATTPNVVLINLQGTVLGPLAFTWSLPNGETCTTAGVSTIQYQLYNPDTSMAMSGSNACADADGGSPAEVTLGGVDGGTLQPGNYSVTIQGCDTYANCDVLYSMGYPAPFGGLFVLPDSLPTPIPVIPLTPM